MGNFGKLDIDVLRAVKWGSDVEVFTTKATKFGALSREDAVEKEIEKFQGCHAGTCVPGLEDVISYDCDLGAIGDFFLWDNLTDNGYVCNLLTSLLWDFVKQGDMEGVCAC